MPADDIAPGEIPATPPVLHPGDIVQVTDQEDRWFPALLVVEEVKAWGVRGLAFRLEGTRPPADQLYYRLHHGKFDRVGRVVVMTPEMAKARDASLATAELVAKEAGMDSPMFAKFAAWLKATYGANADNPVWEYADGDMAAAFRAGQDAGR